MTDPATTSLSAVQSFFRTFSERDLDLAAGVLSDTVVEIIPLSLSGDLEPMSVFDGKAAVLGYLGTIIENFSSAKLTDEEITVSADGATVFVEATGDLTVAQTGQPYRNVYVFKFSIAAGKISHIVEYANPITFAKAMGLPLA